MPQATHAGTSLDRPYICEEEAALPLPEVQHGPEPDPKQLRLLGHVTPCNCRERLHHIAPQLQLPLSQ